MLISLKHLSGYAVHAKEGDFGKIEQFYFDDENWVIRYIIIDIGPWFNRTKVLVLPNSIKKVDWLKHKVVLDLTQEQLLNSPDIDTEQPLSRQMEMQHLDYYRWPYYWTGAGIWGAATTLEGRGQDETTQDLSVSHLRSTQEVLGYQIHATDAEFGRLEDIIVDTSQWKLRYLAVHIKKWLPSKTTLIPKGAVTSISWRLQQIQVSLSEEEIKLAPPFESTLILSHHSEKQLKRYYKDKSDSAA